jgi:hypothetical protein
MVILMTACNDLVEAQAIASTPGLRVEWTVFSSTARAGFFRYSVTILEALGTGER